MKPTAASEGLALKHVEHFEDDDDNDNDSDDVEDVSVHGSWVTRRYPRRKQFNRRDCLKMRSRKRNGQSCGKYDPGSFTGLGQLHYSNVKTSLSLIYCAVVALGVVTVLSAQDVQTT